MALHVRADIEITCVVAGYESGHVAYYVNSSRKAATNLQASRSARPAIYTRDWHCMYLSKPHSQPVLSIVASLDEQYLVSSGADSVIATYLFLPVIESSRDQDEEVHGAHPIEEPHNMLKTGHPGQQGLSVSGTGAMFASAGWDGVVRVYTWGVIKEREVLEWHRDGVYATAFAHALDEGSINSSMTDSSEGAVAQRQGTLAARRERQAKLTPWLVVGGKDGKVSLWDMGA
jgi:ASTRA-associated protein 1